MKEYPKMLYKFKSDHHGKHNFEMVTVSDESEELERLEDGWSESRTATMRGDSDGDSDSSE